MADVDVAIVGRVFSDLIFTGAELPAAGAEVFASGFALSPGGAANRAVAAARLGARTSLVALFGDDPIGEVVFAALQAEPELDLSRSRRGKGFFTPISVAITNGPERSFVTYEEPSPSLAWPIDVSTLAAHVGLDQTLPAWVGQARNSGTRITGGAGWDATGNWSSLALEQLGGVDTVIVNEVEAMAYTRQSDIDSALSVLASRTATAVITLGADGVVAARGQARVRVPSVPVSAIDPTGAGDTFSAAFMVAEAWGWELEQALRLACVSAAFSVQGPGGARSAPHPHDIARLLEHQADRAAWAFVLDWANSTDSPQ